MEVIIYSHKFVILSEKGCAPRNRIYEINNTTEEEGFSRAKRKEAKYYAY